MCGVNLLGAAGSGDVTGGMRKKVEELLALAKQGVEAEIVNATKKIAQEAIDGALRPDSIDEKTFSDHLYTARMPDPDLVIRTSGERRISNFLLWQISYAELYFTEKHWPDFNGEDLKEAILDYQGRKRRFGASE